MRRAAWLLVLLSACTWGARHPPAPTSGGSAAQVADDYDQLDWLANEPLFIVVRKSCRTLDLYRFGTRIRSYPAVFGIGGFEDKRYEGDHRTPTGLYAIIEKRPHPRWRWFMLLDYPKATDMNRHRRSVAAGNVPAGAGAGGSVGIHGTDRPELNEKGVDWTWGCVSVDNPAIEEIAKIVPVGTPVLIED